jgi:hypothetical protein
VECSRRPGRVRGVGRGDLLRGVIVTGGAAWRPGSIGVVRGAFGSTGRRGSGRVSSDEVGNPRGAGAVRLRSRRWARNRTRCKQHSEAQPRISSRSSARRRMRVEPGKRVRGRVGKPAPRQREGEPQRGERHEGTPCGLASAGACGLSGGSNPPKLKGGVSASPQRHGRIGLGDGSGSPGGARP